jgi:integrase
MASRKNNRESMKAFGCSITLKQMANGTPKWHVDCRKKGVPKTRNGSPFARGTFDTKSEALEHAKAIQGHLEFSDDEEIKAQEAFKPHELVSAVKSLKIIKQETGEDFNLSGALAKFSELVIQIHKDSQSQSIESLANQFVCKKSSKYGGKGHRELSQSQKTQYKRVLELFVRKFGKMTAIECFKKRKFKTEVLSLLNSSTKKRSWELLAPQTKKNYSTNLVSFFEWIREEEGIPFSNPLRGLGGEYRIDLDQAEILSNAQIKSLFTTASNDPQFWELIPYLAFGFYSGARPSSELAHSSNVERRFDYKNMERWALHSEKSGGLLYRIQKEEDKYHPRRGIIIKCKMTKLSKGRQADLHSTGVAWVKYYFEELLKGSLPLSDPDPKKATTIKFNRNNWDDLRKKAGINNWPNDAMRHSFATNVHKHYPEHKHYWLDKCGHSLPVFRKHYENSFVTPADAKDYFFDNLPPFG